MFKTESDIEPEILSMVEKIRAHRETQGTANNVSNTSQPHTVFKRSVTLKPVRQDSIPQSAVKERTLTVMKEVISIKTGGSFGELALMSNKPRAATIYCKPFEDGNVRTCYFATLNREDFKKSIGRIEQK